MRSLVLAGILMAVTGTEAATSSYLAGKAFYVFSQGAVARVEADGTVSWRTPKITQVGDLWVTTNSILYTDYRGVREVTLDGTHRELFHFETPGDPQTYACQRLPNGNIALAECLNARILEIAPNGKIAHELKLAEKGHHGYMRGLRVTKQGTYLVAHLGGGVKEYDANGKVLWAYRNPAFSMVYLAIRLANGNTLLSCGENRTAGLLEVTPDKKVVWSVTNADLANQLPGQAEPLKFCTGLFILPNGNIAVTNWIGHGHLRKAPHILEISRDKKIVWSYSNFEAFPMLSNIYALDAKGMALDGEGKH